MPCGNDRSGVAHVQKECRTEKVKPARAADAAKIANRIVWAIFSSLAPLGDLARVLRFPKLNVSCWFDGSELVAIEHWGYRRPQWCMKHRPADWQPLPDVYRLERERAAGSARPGAHRRAGANGCPNSGRRQERAGRFSGVGQRREELTPM